MEWLEVGKTAAAAGPLAGVLMFIWWVTWNAWKEERKQRQKEQRRWNKFLMTHMSDTYVPEDDDEDEE